MSLRDWLPVGSGTGGDSDTGVASGSTSESGRADGAPSGAPPEPLDPDRGGDPLLSVRDLRSYYPVRGGVLGRRVGDVRAVDGVSFDLYPGETLAVVGESGSGKTTLAETVLGLHDPDGGTVHLDGRPVHRLSGGDLRRLRRDVGVVFQDPQSSLNERLTVRRIVREPMVVHDAYAGERGERVRELLADVGLDPEAHAGRYPHELSGGQRQRVAIARALALEPALLVADEPTSALDVSVQAGILRLLDRLQAEHDLTYLLVSHDLSVVRHVADRVAVMYLGRFVERAGVEALFDAPAHPYTEALLSDVPRFRGEGSGRAGDGAPRERIVLTGEPPDPADPPAGCPFHPRCHLKPELSADEQRRCEDERPPLDDATVLDGADRSGGDDSADGDGGHPAACHFRPE